MATNTLAPNGLQYITTKGAFAITLGKSRYRIKNGFGSKIAIGDIVQTGTGGNQGYVVPCGNNPTTILGVFAGVLPFFDTTLQATSHGLLGSYSTTAAPVTGVDIDCLVWVADPNQLWKVQVQAGTWLESWRGNNANWVAGTNGVPSALGISTLALDSTTIATTNTLPFRIEEQVGVVGSPQDPTNTNPWVAVTFNPGLIEGWQSTGI